MSDVVTTGSNNKADCVLSIQRADSTIVEVKSKNAALVAPGLEQLILGEIKRHEAPPMLVQLEDFGALDWVVKARFDEAMHMLPWVKPLAPALPARAYPSENKLNCKSRLYVPGNNPRLMQGADTSGADIIILDLEDSVPLSEKKAARAMVKALLGVMQCPAQLAVRINSFNEGAMEDLQQVMQGAPHGICIPKCEEPQAVQIIANELDRLELKYGIPPSKTWLMPIIESPWGVERALPLAQASSRISIIAFGAEDYSLHSSCTKSPQALLFARSRIVNAARAAGVLVSDTVFSGIDDMPSLLAECQLAKDLGFDGKGAINPRQIDTIHQVFLPGPEEIRTAQAMVNAAREAAKTGKGALNINGTMLDLPVLLRAKRILEIAEEQGL